MRHGRLLAGHHVPLRLVLELLHALPRQAGRLAQVRTLARGAAALQMREPAWLQQIISTLHAFLCHGRTQQKIEQLPNVQWGVGAIAVVPDALLCMTNGIRHACSCS